MSAVIGKNNSTVGHWREYNEAMLASSVHLYNDRYLPYTENSKVYTICILDLLHVRTKKFVIQWNTEPNASRNDAIVTERFFNGCNIILTDLHTIIAQINQYSNDGALFPGFIVLNLDYENSVATFKRPLIKQDETSMFFYPRCFKASNSGFECLSKYGYYDLKKFFFYKTSYLNDCDVEQKIIQIELTKQLRITGVVNNNLYGFWKEDGDKLDFSKLVQVCLKTKEQTTLKVSGWPTDRKYYAHEGYNSELWINRTLVKTFTSNGKITYFFVMHLDSLHWRKLDIQLDLIISNLFSTYNNILIVETRIETNKGRSYYRFNLDRPDTLVNLSLYAMKQNSPIFQDAVEYIPNQFRCPFNE